MKKSFLLSLLVLFCIMLAPAADLSAQQLQKVFNYQANLLDDRGDPKEGSVTVLFEIWDAEFGGNVVWTEPAQSLVATKGYINAYLGMVSPMKLKFNRQYWLQVTVDGKKYDRTMFTSTPYALYAIDADTALHAFMADAVVAKGVKQTMLDDGIQAIPWGNAGGDLDGTYPNPRLRPNSVVDNILPGTITFDKLHPDARIPHGKAGGDLTDEYPNPSIAANAVTEIKIRDGAVTSRKIANGTIKVEDLNPTEFLYWDKDYRDDLTIITEFGGDVEGTYNDIQIKEAVITEFELAPTGVIAGAYGYIRTENGVSTKYMPYFTVDQDGRLVHADQYPLTINPTDLENTTVTAGTYGDATHIPNFVVDEDGRLTFAGQTQLVVGPNELTATGVAAGSYGAVGDACTPGMVPYFTVDEDGRITAAGQMNITPNFMVPGSEGQFLVSSTAPGCSTTVSQWKNIAFDPEYFSGSIFTGNGLQLANNAVKANNIDGRGVQAGWVLMADGSNNVNWVKYALTLPFEGTNSSDVTGFKVRNLDNPTTNINNVNPAISGITEDDFGYGGLFSNLNINSGVAALKAVSESNNAAGLAFEAVSDPPAAGYVAKIWDDNHRNNANGRGLLIQSNSAASFPYQSLLNNDPTDLDEATLVVKNTNANANKIAIKTYGDIVANSTIFADQLAAAEAIYVGGGNNIVTITPPANAGDPLAFDNSVSIDGDLTVTGTIHGNIHSNMGTFTDLSVTNNATVGGNVTVSGMITGNLTGNVTGNVTGNLTGNVNGGYVDVQGAYLNLASTAQLNANTGASQGPGAAGNFLVSRGAGLSPEWTSTISGPLTVASINATTGSITTLTSTNATITNGTITDLDVTNNLVAGTAAFDNLFVVNNTYVGGALTVDGGITGNLTGNVTAGNIVINGTNNSISGVANISATTFTGGSFVGDGSQLTGVTPSFDALLPSTTGNPNALLVSGTFAPTGAGVVTANDLVAGTIIDSDVNAAAAIAGTKINPNFGSQTVSTTGSMTAGNAALAATAGSFQNNGSTPAITVLGTTGTTAVDVTGNVNINGKAVSTATVSGDGANTLTTKGYVDNYVNPNVLTTTTQFGGDVTGTYNAMVVNHSLQKSYDETNGNKIVTSALAKPVFITNDNNAITSGGSVLEIQGTGDAIENGINLSLLDVATLGSAGKANIQTTMYSNSLIIDNNKFVFGDIASVRPGPSNYNEVAGAAGQIGDRTAYGAIGWQFNDGTDVVLSSGVYGESSSAAPNFYAGYFDGKVHVTGKVTSVATADADNNATLTTKGYVDGKLNALTTYTAGSGISFTQSGPTSYVVAASNIANANISATAAIDFSKINVPNGAVTDAMIDAGASLIRKTVDNKYPALDGSLITNIAAANLTFPIDRTVNVANPNAAIKLTNTGDGAVYSAVVNNTLGKAITISVPGATHNENAVTIDYAGIGNAMYISSTNAINTGYGFAVDYAGSGNGIASFANGGGSAYYAEVNGSGNGMNIKIQSNNGKGLFLNVPNTSHNESAFNIDYQGQGSALNILIGDNLANTGMGAIIDDYRAAGVGLAVLKNSAPDPTLNTSLYVSNGLTSNNSVALHVGRGSTVVSYATTANADLSNLGYASVIHYTGVANVTLLPATAQNGQVLLVSVTNNVTVAGVAVTAGESIMLVYSGGAWRPVR